MKVYKLNIRLRKVGSCQFWNQIHGNEREAGGNSAAKRAEAVGLTDVLALFNLVVI